MAAGNQMGICRGRAVGPMAQERVLRTVLSVCLQSFQAALQTQWSWMLQLCCCIEAHLKENTAYFQVRTRASLSPVLQS